MDKAAIACNALPLRQGNTLLSRVPWKGLRCLAGRIQNFLVGGHFNKKKKEKKFTEGAVWLYVKCILSFEKKRGFLKKICSVKVLKN